jgi:hypothetical protein
MRNKKKMSHGYLKKDLKKLKNGKDQSWVVKNGLKLFPILYRLGGLKNSTTMKQEPKKED